MDWGGNIDDDRYVEFINKLTNSGFEELDFGSFRTCFVRDKVVIKIPLNKDGIIDNMIEAKAWRHYRDCPTSLGLNLAPCRLLRNGCLMMVLVDTSMPSSDMPEWAHGLDGSQVGLYKDRVVAYDYALDLKERFRWEQELNVRSEYFHEEWLTDRPHFDGYEELEKSA